METKNFKVEFKELKEDGNFVAYISTRSIDAYNDRVLPESFKRTISHNNGKFPILWMHDSSKPIGISTRMTIEKDGVKAFGKLNLDTELGREVYSGMKFDPPYIDRTSIGFTSIEDDFDTKSNVRTIKELKLLEFSLITRNFSANEEALISNVKSKGDLKELEERINNLEKKLRDGDGMTEKERRKRKKEDEEKEREKRRKKRRDRDGDMEDDDDEIEDEDDEEEEVGRKRHKKRDKSARDGEMHDRMDRMEDMIEEMHAKVGDMHGRMIDEDKDYDDYDDDDMMTDSIYPDDELCMGKRKKK